MYNKEMDWFSRSTHISQKGSALFIILVAVALFAALSYVVAGMMRSGGSGTDINQERAEIYAGEILDYARNVRQVVQDLRISNGCRNTEISFENPVETGYANGTDTDCQIFHSDGGGMSWVEPSADLLDSAQSGETGYGQWFATGVTCVINIGNGATGCNTDSVDNEDLIFALPYIDQAVCIAINESLGITSGGAAPPQDGGTAWAWTKFTGSYTDGAQLGSSPNRMAGCFESDTLPTSGTYHFYQVLVAR